MFICSLDAESCLILYGTMVSFTNYNLFPQCIMALFCTNGIVTQLQLLDEMVVYTVILGLMSQSYQTKQFIIAAFI